MEPSGKRAPLVRAGPVGPRRAGRVFAETRRVDHKRAGMQVREHRVIVACLWGKDVFSRNTGMELRMNPTDLLKPRWASVRNDDPRGSVGGAGLLHQMPGCRDGRTAGALGKTPRTG